AFGLVQSVISKECYFLSELAIHTQDELLLIESRARFILENIADASKRTHPARGNSRYKGSRQRRVYIARAQQVQAARSHEVYSSRRPARQLPLHTKRAL